MNAREMLDRSARLDAMAARLAPLDPIVLDFGLAWDELATVKKSRKGTKAARLEKAESIAKCMRETWPLVSLVLRSRQIIARLRGQVDHVGELEAFDDRSYFEQVAHVDSLWIQIRVLREIVPKAERGERGEAGRSKATKASADRRKREREERDAEILTAALSIRQRNPHMTISDLARTLDERDGLGGFEALRKRLTRLLRA